MICGWCLLLTGEAGSVSSDFNTAEIDFWRSSSVWGRAQVRLDIAAKHQILASSMEEKSSLPPAVVTRHRTHLGGYKKRLTEEVGISLPIFLHDDKGWWAKTLCDAMTSYPTYTTNFLAGSLVNCDRWALSLAN